MSDTGRPCSIAAALDVVGDRWSLLAVREVLFGNHRFSEIARNTGAPRVQKVDRRYPSGGYRQSFGRRAALERAGAVAQGPGTRQTRSPVS